MTLNAYLQSLKEAGFSSETIENNALMNDENSAYLLKHLSTNEDEIFDATDLLRDEPFSGQHLSSKEANIRLAQLLGHNPAHHSEALSILRA